MEKLAKDEYEKAGPTLGKFYNKLIRLNSSNGINIIQENEGISLIDDKGKIFCGESSFEGLLSTLRVSLIR